MKRDFGSVRMTQPTVADFVHGEWRQHSKEWKKALKTKNDPWPTVARKWEP